MTALRRTQPAVRAARTAAVLLALVAPVLVMGCAAQDPPQTGHVTDSSGSSVPGNGPATPLPNGFAFGWY
jgi:hypothetical protein